MRRREFIAGLGSAAAWPLVARAQQARLPVIGYLNVRSRNDDTLRAVFHQGLNEAGYVEGKNVAVEYRYTETRVNLLPELAADLVRRGVAVIYAGGAPTVALAAKAATATIPIVFAIGSDPVQRGILPSLNRPGGNVTGIVLITSQASSKRLGLLHEVVPRATQFALLVNSTTAYEPSIADAQTLASAIGAKIEVFAAATSREIDAAFASLVQKRSDALLINSGAFFIDRRVQIVTLAARHAVPAAYFEREFSEVGGLMSYGANFADQTRQAGIYVGRILKGEKAGDLPVLLPTKYEFVINSQTARTLGLTIPPTLLAIADEVIE
jgi:putative ABC transport system substrate-binding protein